MYDVIVSTTYIIVPTMPLFTKARRKEVKKRRLGSVRMQLSSGLGTKDQQIALSIYKTVRRLFLHLMDKLWVMI